jgi:hypothetical protein
MRLAKTRAMILGALLVSASALTVIKAEPASALPGCAYPYVCLYKLASDGSTVKTGQFRDFTTGWQWLTISKGAMWGWNTRHDDVLRVLYSGGVVSCFPSNSQFAFSGYVLAIRIDPSPTC